MSSIDTQELFNRVSTHLLSMTQQSRLDSIGCAYRTADGNRCAVGCLIPDRLYEEEFEGFPVDKLLYYKGATNVLGFDVTDRQRLLLTKLQEIHDSGLNWNYHKGGLTQSGKNAIAVLGEQVRNNEFD